MNSLNLEFYKKLNKEDKIEKYNYNINNIITFEKIKKLLYLYLLIYVTKLIYDIFL